MELSRILNEITKETKSNESFDRKSNENPMNISIKYHNNNLINNNMRKKRKLNVSYNPCNIVSTNVSNKSVNKIDCNVIGKEKNSTKLIEFSQIIKKYLPHLSITDHQRLLELLLGEKYGMNIIDLCKINEMNESLDFSNDFGFSLWQQLFLKIGYGHDSIFSKRCTLRKGKWTKSEEHYTLLLLQGYHQGYIHFEPNEEKMTLRKFLADHLHSDPLRISKKLGGNKYFEVDKYLAKSKHKSEKTRLIATVSTLLDEKGCMESIEKTSNKRLSPIKGSTEQETTEKKEFLSRFHLAKIAFLKSVQLEALVSLRKYMVQ